MAIADFKDKQNIRGIFYCQYKSTGVTKAGKDYFNLNLTDKTGSISAKVWDVTSPGIREFDVKDFVEATGSVQIFNGGLQLVISNISVAEPGTYDPHDFMPTSKRDIEEMYTQLLAVTDKVTNPYLRKLIDMYFREDTAFIAKFKEHSAAKAMHHGFVGGLLEHTLGVVSNCDWIADRYPWLDKSLLLTAALFHDIGKIYELSPFPDNDYTKAGDLLGHIVIGYNMINTSIGKIQGFPNDLKLELEHCIIAHHGKEEFGSPKKPGIAEALALTFADDLDAKMEMCIEGLDSMNEEDEKARPKGLDAAIRRTGEWDVNN